MKLFLALSFVILSTSAYALPTISGNFSVALTELRGTGAADGGRARAAFLKSRSLIGRTASGMPTTRETRNVYAAEVGFGESKIYYQLIIDTGSSITWCKDYIESPSTKPTGRNFVVTYGTGGEYFEGDDLIDQVALSTDLVITNQHIGGAYDYSEFDGLDGMLGLGPIGKTRGTIPSEPDALVPTVMDTLKSEGVISEQVFGVYFPPTAYTGRKAKGTLTFGGADTSLFEGTPRFVSLTKIPPSSGLWGVDLMSCTYGELPIIRYPIAGVVDTGNGVIQFADDVFYAYMDAIPGVRYDTVVRLLEIPSASIEHMQPLHFKFGEQEQEFTLDVNAQLVPPEMNKDYGGEDGKRYGFVHPMGHFSGTGLDFILGVPFMRTYYTIHDTENGRLGFAKAKPLASTG